MSISQLFKVAVVGILMVGQAAADDGPQADGPPKFITIKPVRLKEIMPASGGVVEAGRAEDLVCRSSGETTIASLVPEGTRVKPGDLVCQLDATALRDQLTTQTINVMSAQATYTNAQLTREIAEIAVSEYQLGTLVMERAILEGQEKIHLAAILPDHERLDRMINAQKRARDALKQGLAKPTPSEILAEITIDTHVEKARDQLEEDQKRLEGDKFKKEMLEKYTSRQKILMLKSEIEKARSDELAKKATWELERAKERALTRQIEACRLVAHIEGIVLYANDPKQAGPRAIEKGAKVHERQTIARVVDLENAPIQIHAKVSESRVDHVRPGQEARAWIRGQGETKFQGRVKTVASVPDRGTESEGPEKKVFTVVIELEKRTPGVRIGTDSEVSIVRIRDDVIVIPKKAVSATIGPRPNDRGIDKVAVKKPDGSLEWRLVGWGRMGRELIEIEKGLKSGETVLANLRGQTFPDFSDDELEVQDPPAPAKPADPPR